MRSCGASSRVDVRARRSLAATTLALVLAACELPEAPPDVAKPFPAVFERGPVSHYGLAFAGKPTASGEPFDPEALTMAHPTLPFGTRVRVTNLENQRSVEVVVNDRGPAVKPRIADLSVGAARRIGMIADGVVEAELAIVAPAKRPASSR